MGYVVVYIIVVGSFVWFGFWVVDMFSDVFVIRVEKMESKLDD